MWTPMRFGTPANPLITVRSLQADRNIYADLCATGYPSIDTPEGLDPCSGADQALTGSQVVFALGEAQVPNVNDLLRN